MKKFFAIISVTLICAFLFSSCSVKGKNSLISYAKKNYGDCEFVKEEVEGKGKDKKRTVYLIDKDTGIEYTVTSKMSSISIDGSNFGHVEDTSSDFLKLYWEYVIDEAKDELNSISKEHDVDLTNPSEILFNGRPSYDEPETVAKEVYNILKDYDKKGLLDLTLLVFSENKNAYLGVIDGESGEWSGNDSYKVIDYVLSIFPDAKYSSDIFGIPESYVNSNDLDRLIRLGGRNSSSFDVEFYLFSDSKYGTLVAFDMEEIGLKGIFVGTYESYGGGETLDCDALDIHHDETENETEKNIWETEKDTNQDSNQEKDINQDDSKNVELILDTEISTDEIEFYEQFPEKIYKSQYEEVEECLISVFGDGAQIIDQGEFMNGLGDFYQKNLFDYTDGISVLSEKFYGMSVDFDTVDKTIYTVGFHRNSDLNTIDNNEPTSFECRDSYDRLYKIFNEKYGAPDMEFTPDQSGYVGALWKNTTCGEVWIAWGDKIFGSNQADCILTFSRKGLN